MKVFLVSLLLLSAFGLCNVVDGSYQIYEECDDNNTIISDGCSYCTVDTHYTCTGWPSDCQVTHLCGNGVRDTVYEECDDGN